MKDEMYLVSITARHDKVAELRDALYAIGVLGITVSSAEGHGAQMGYEMQYRGVRRVSHSYAKTLVETVVCEIPVDDVIKAAVGALKTEEAGDGKISVERVSRVIRVRTGEEDLAALTNYEPAG
ncbi:MAG: P-II family nitrogen regulator [Oscillospiraceae bacterium]|jgi:nitrogen regulatory protein PII|nr:P-II family nitrogen regulator [Oscillospiraceae bacterium]